MAAEPPSPDITLTNITGFSFTNEYGWPVSLRDFPGQAVASTFFFTRGRVPEFYPQLRKDSSSACKRLEAMTGGPIDCYLCALSFDRADIPAVLV